MRSLIANISKSLTKKSLWLYATRFGSILIQSISLFLVAVFVSIEEFGKFSFIYSASQVASVIFGAGGEQMLIREVVYRDKNNRGQGSYEIIFRSFQRSAILALVALSLWVFGFLLLKLSFSDPYVYEILLIIITGSAMSFLYNSISIVHIAKSASASMQLREFYPFLLFLIGLLLSELFDFISAYNLMLIFSICVLSCFIYSIIISLEYLIHRKKLSSNSSLRCLNAYKPFWGTSIIGSLFAQSDILIAKLLVGESEFGTYALIRRVTNLVSLPQVIANWVIVIDVAKNYSVKNFSGLKKNASDGLWIAVPVSIIIAIIIFLTHQFWFSLFNAVATKNSVIVLMFLILAQLVNVFSGANFVFAAQCKEEGYVLKARLLSLMVGVLIMSVGGYLFGVMGIVIGISLAITLINILVVLHVKKKIGVCTSLKF